jgi:hypothetical protein
MSDRGEINDDENRVCIVGEKTQQEPFREFEDRDPSTTLVSTCDASLRHRRRRNGRAKLEETCAPLHRDHQMYLV